MQLSIAVYQHSVESEIHWVTVGLGSITQRHTARSEAKLRRRMLEKVKSALAELDSALKIPMRPPLALELRRERLELRLDGSGSRRKTSGVFPVMLEPRSANLDRPIRIGYHPLRQDEWFVVNDELGIQRSAELFFQQAWADLGDDQIASLETNKKDKIKFLAFDHTPPSLIDTLEDDEDVWHDLRADGGPDRKKSRRQLKVPLRVLREVGVDQTQRAADDALDGGIERGRHTKRLSLLLGGKRRQPAIVCGPPGCGKSTLLAAWVGELLDEQGYRVHRNLDRVTHVYRLSGQRLIAGMSYLGQWEQRCMDLLTECRHHDVALWVDDLPAFGQLGRSRDSDRNLAEVFRGPLARGELLLFGECTIEQLQRLEDDAPSFAALFVPLMLPPTSRGETLRILLRRARQLELAHRIAFEPDVYQHLLALSEALLPGALPAKALVPLDDLARRANAQANADAQRSTGSATRTPSERAIATRDLLDWLAAHTGLPRDLLAPREPLLRADLRRIFERRIMGQTSAIEAAIDLVLRVRSGMTAADRPLAVYLFTGPTGTGKTALARAIAGYLYSDPKRLIRLDMGEHSSADAVSRLVGDRFNPQGQLVQRIREQPFSVLLLDEVEKAHPAVLNLLLQVFDDGRLTDAAGNMADFTHTVVVLTSNLGAGGQPAVGFSESQRSLMARFHGAVRAFFSPELFNRIDRVIAFGPLNQADARQIAEKELSALLARRGLTERKVLAETTQGVLDKIVREGFDPLLGARTVKRYLEQHVTTLLSDTLSAAPAASLRKLVLYVSRDGPLAVHDEALTEADSTTISLPIEPMLSLPIRDLQARLPRTLDDLEALLEDERIEQIADRMRDHLQSLQRQDAQLSLDDADALYSLDALRGEITRLKGTIGYLHVTKRADRQRILQSLAEVYFLRRALDRITETDRHTVQIKLQRIGLRPRGSIATETTLVDELARAYLDQRARLESFSVLLENGQVASGNQYDVLPSPLDWQVGVLQLYGVDVLDFYSGEHGCHLWRSAAFGVEIVRVDVLSPSCTTRDLIEAHVSQRAAFHQALKSGSEPLPQNPAGLLPLAREYRFDPPTVQPTAQLEVEDYPLGYAFVAPVRRIAEALPRLWLLRMSRQDEQATGALDNEPKEIRPDG